MHWGRSRIRLFVWVEEKGGARACYGDPGEDGEACNAGRGRQYSSEATYSCGLLADVILRDDIYLLAVTYQGCHPTRISHVSLFPTLSSPNGVHAVTMGKGTLLSIRF